MPMIRAMRLLNAVEAGTTTGAQLQTLLAADPGRLAEWNVLLGMRGQTRRMAASSTAMNAVAASSTAMNAVAASSQAMQAVAASSTAREAFFGSSFAVGKGLETLTGTTNATLAGLQTMNAVIASSTAMNAVAASSTAMAAVIASSTAMTALLANSNAWAAVVASSQAMQAVAANSQAMQAVAASQNALAAIRQSSTAISAINASSQALDILYNAATKFTYAGGSWSANPVTLVTGNFLLVRIRQTANQAGFGNGTLNGQHIRIGGSGWTATNGQLTNNLINRTTLPHVYDNALRAVNNTTIQYYLYNSYEIAYLAA